MIQNQMQWRSGSGNVNQVSVVDKLKCLCMFQYSTCRCTTYLLFNYTKAERSEAYWCWKLKTERTVVIRQQSSTASHLQNIIKTIDLSFNANKMNLVKTRICLCLGFVPGGCRYCAHVLRKDGININVSPSNMPRQSFFLPPGVVLKNIQTLICWEIVTSDCSSCKLSNYPYILQMMHTLFFYPNTKTSAFEVQTNQQATAIRQNGSFKWANTESAWLN